jgi:hypothetical protein
MEAKYLQVNRELVNMRSANMILVEKERNISTQREGLLLMISDLNQSIKDKTK